MSHENLHQWKRGDQLKAEWLDQQRRVIERNDRNQGQYSSAGFTADKPYRETQVVWVRLSEVMGVQSSSGFQNREGTVVFYDPDTGNTLDSHTVSVVTELFWDLPIDGDELIPCWWHSGVLIPLWNRTVRHFITVDDDEDEYPNISQCPNTYPIKFIRITYPEVAGHQSPTIEYLDSSAGPDDFIHNLYGGEDSYLPEGTVGWCYSVTQQWFTYMLWMADTCSSTSSSSQSQMSSSSSSSKSSSSSSNSSSSSSSKSSSSSSSSSTSSSSSSTSKSSSSSSSNSSSSSSSSASSSSSSFSSSESSGASSYSSSSADDESGDCDQSFPASITDIDGYDGTKTQVLIHAGGCLRFIDTTTC